MMKETASNQGDKGDHTDDAPNAAIADLTSHNHDVYELHTLDMVQSDPHKTRSRLRLLAILIALVVGSSLCYTSISQEF
jgi:hypothetical protein